jgi:hypothetical protein
MLKPVPRRTNRSLGMVKIQVQLAVSSWFCAARFVLLLQRQES